MIQAMNSKHSESPKSPSTCVLCREDGGQLIWRGARNGDALRVIRADEPGWPAFYRVIWDAHVAEFSDLDAAQRLWCMDAVVVVEKALREHLQPRATKINIATLGNMVAHLHWHVIARYDWDSHFPGAVWAQAQRTADEAKLAQLALSLPAAEQAMCAALDALQK